MERESYGGDEAGGERDEEAGEPVRDGAIWVLGLVGALNTASMKPPGDVTPS